MLNFIDNYFRLFRVLLGQVGHVALDPELVWKHYGEPDDWDPIHVWYRNLDGEGMRLIEAKDMFSYISPKPL